MQTSAKSCTWEETRTLHNEISWFTEHNRRERFRSLDHNDLKASFRVAKAASRANQTLGLIRRTFSLLDCQLMKHVFVTLVRPHLEYGNVVWHYAIPHFRHSYLKKDMQLLEGVQHRATRMVPGLSKLNYEQRLIEEYEATSIYKSMNWIYRMNSADILPRHRTAGPATRGHSLKLEKRDC